MSEKECLELIYEAKKIGLTTKEIRQWLQNIIDKKKIINNSEMVLEGILCHVCGCFIDHEYCGYPKTCNDCEA